MERLARILLVALSLLLVVVAVVAVLDSGGSDAGGKSALLERLATDLQSRGVPPKLSGCLIRDLDRRLTEEEAEQAAPRNGHPFRQSGLACARRLSASGAYTARQLMRFGRRLDPLGF